MNYNKNLTAKTTTITTTTANNTTNTTTNNNNTNNNITTTTTTNNNNNNKNNNNNNNNNNSLMLYDPHEVSENAIKLHSSLDFTITRQFFLFFFKGDDYQRHFTIALIKLSPDLHFVL